MWLGKKTGGRNRDRENYERGERRGRGKAMKEHRVGCIILQCSEIAIRVLEWDESDADGSSLRVSRRLIRTWRCKGLF